MEVAYFSYPYSDDPERRTKEAIEIAQRIMEKHSNIIIIIPHITVDPLAEGVKSTLRFWIADWELEIISRCDTLILGCQLDYSLSPGMVWEHAFAKRNGKKIITKEELLE